MQPDPHDGTTQEELLIMRCLEHYAACGLEPHSVCRWADQERRSRNHREVDAIADAPVVPNLAIEHTSLESFEGQLEDDHKVVKFFSEIEASLRESVPQGVVCAMPVRAFKKGFDWPSARVELTEYIRENCKSLPEGSSSHQITGAPFQFKLFLWPKSEVEFHFARISPGQNQIQVDLTASVEQALGHKKQRLGEYLANGNRTLLLMESRDLALIDHTDVYKAFLRAQRTVGAEHLADVIYVNTGNAPDTYWFCFLGPEPLLDGMNLANFKLGPKHFQEWESAL